MPKLGVAKISSESQVANGCNVFRLMMRRYKGDWYVAYLSECIMQLHGELAGGLVGERLRVIALLLQARRQRRDLQRLLRHARLQHIAFCAHLLANKYYLLVMMLVGSNK